MKSSHLLTWAALLAALTTPCARAATWQATADGQAFSKAENWSDNKALDPKQGYVIDNGASVTRSGQTKIAFLTLGGGSELTIKGGKHENILTGGKTYDQYFRESGGAVHHSNGAYNIGHMLSIGSGNAERGGAYHLSGGRLIVFRGSRSQIQNGALPNSSIEVGDELNHNTALLEISGSALLDTRVGVSIGKTGVFQVRGARAKIGIGRHLKHDGGWAQLAGGTLKFELDRRGPSAIQIIDKDQDPGVTIDFHPGALLELGFAPDVEPHAGTWTVFQAENTVFDDTTLAGLLLSPDTDASTGPDDAGWSFGYENNFGNGRIKITYTKAPAPEDADAPVEPEASAEPE